MSNARRQGIFWILTIPYSEWNQPSSLPPPLSWLRGQQEIGESGYHHWQLICGFRSKASLRAVKSLFGPSCHGELTKSSAADSYVWKESTAVPETKFELGAKTIDQSSKTDWEEVWDRAKSGDILSIPANIRVVSYRTIRAIASDYEVICLLIVVG